MITIITTARHGYTHASLRSESAVSTRVISYSELAQLANDPPRSTYVFTDVDRMTPVAAASAAARYRSMKDRGIKVLNDPARMLSRFGLLRALNRAGINDFDAYRAEDLEKPRRWPVFLRLEGDHVRPISDLLYNQADLEAALEDVVAKGAPRSAILIIEYAAEQLGEGLFRKLSVFRVGDRLLGYTCVHDDQWIVKYGKNAIARPEHYDQEYEFVEKGTFAEVMRPVFDIAGVEYGRVDFGLVGGRPQIYEINSNPHIELVPKASPVERRNRSNALFRTNLLEALAEIDTPAARIAATAA